MSCRTGLKLLFICTVLLCAAASLAQVAPTTIFQLDGNAAQSNGYSGCLYTAPCDYWNLLNGSGNNSPTGGIGTGSAAGHSLVRTYISGLAAVEAFTGGGSKDPKPISSWTYALHGSPDKDTINAGYAAAYQQGGDFEIIFGADRQSPNGDANIGIWFFQDAVSLNGNGGFNGVHKDHDIFIISAFVNGGGKAPVSVYEWKSSCTASHYGPPANPGDCADTNLGFLGSVAAGSACGTSAFCAVTNAGTTQSTWEGAIASPLFFEGGVDITYVLAQVGVTQLPCFASFLVDTRSSQSTSSVLKDFVLGGFPVCGLSITKTCSAAVNAAGTGVDFSMSGIVTNTGIGTLYNVQAIDKITGGATLSPVSVSNNTQNSTNFGTSTLGAGETGTWSASDSSTTAISQSDTATAKGSTSQSGTPQDVTSSNTASATCGTNPSTALTVTKSCTTTLAASGGDVHVVVNYSGSVCNTGPSQVTGIALTDYEHTSTTATTPAPAMAGGLTTLGPCTTFDQSGKCSAPICRGYTGSYVASTDTPVLDQLNNPGQGPGRFNFDDLVTISNAHATVGSLTALSNQTDARCNATYGCAAYTCPICDGSGECTP